MATITLKNIPEELLRRMKERAAQNQRSLNSEVIACLKAAVQAERVDVDALLARARSLRARVGGYLTDEELERMKDEGRP